MPRNREEADLFFCSVTPLSDSVSEGATISVQWEPPDRLRRESFEGARKEG